MSLWDERLEPLIEYEPNSGCWLWSGSLNWAGYGRIVLGDERPRAHRLSYEHHKGQIPTGLVVCHTCDTPCCVNPDHLWLGTNVQNTRDKVLKHRAAKKLTPALVIEIFNASGTQQEIADRFGVSQNRVSMIRDGRSWSHVTGAPYRRVNFLSRAEKRARLSC